jgi:hypothetical protein
MMPSGTYPSSWNEIADLVEQEAGYRCVRCGHPAESPGIRIPCDRRCDPARHPGGLNDGKQRVLTIQHLTGQKNQNAWWNLAALCQVCHLKIQAKVVMDRPWAWLPHSEWFRPYVAGFYAYKYLGQDLSKEEALDRLEELLALERITQTEVTL